MNVDKINTQTVRQYAAVFFKSAAIGFTVVGLIRMAVYLYTN